jgi:hypothetical protein
MFCSQAGLGLAQAAQGAPLRPQAVLSVPDRQLSPSQQPAQLWAQLAGAGGTQVPAASSIIPEQQR